MKLQSLLEAKVSQIFTVNFRGHPNISYSFVGRKVGVDGADRPIYVGHCSVHDETEDTTDMMYAVFVLRRPDGQQLLAGIYFPTQADAAKAAGTAIAGQIKAYGPNRKNKLENWTTYTLGETEVEGYDASAD